MAITCNHISKTYQGRDQTVTALQNVTFTVPEQQFVCLVGPSGCGKSTLLKIIDDLLEPTDGEIVFAQPQRPNRPRTAMIFQEQGLFPWMTVVENAAFGLETQGMGRRERQQMARDFLDRIGLNGFETSYPHELSGGMRQRVSIARAFLTDPQILLMDEPFASLDAQTRLLLQQELLQLWREKRTTVVYVTHDIEEAVLMGDRVLVMSGRPGHIRADIPIPLPRPRELGGETAAEITELRWQIWKMLETEVQDSLNLPE
jgi:NitT/TauT family transport system ATP-binding protein